jgi:copper chaperone
MYEFKVQGMTCGGCVKSVTNSIKKVDADASVHVDLSSQIIQIQSSKSQKDFSASIENAGFDVLSAKDV